MGSGTVDPQSAVIQDATGAILLRLAEEARSIRVGQLVEVLGVRSTKSGMESLRVSTPARILGSAPEPTPLTLRTGDAGEPAEAQLVITRGALVASARRASSGTVSFEIDDGSGPLRVVAGAGLGMNRDALTAGTWVEVRGVLGQETTGSKPQEGYRIWPRASADVRVLAGAAEDSAGLGSAAAGSAGGGADASGLDTSAAPSLDAVDSPELGTLRVGATLVAGPWTELGVAGLLWDGSRLVAVDATSRDRLQRAVAPRRPPIALELAHLRALDAHRRLGIPVVELGSGSTDTVAGSAATAPPTSSLPGAAEPASWIAVVGRVVTSGEGRVMRLDGREVPIEWLCRSEAPQVRGSVAVTGVGIGDPARILVPCGGIRPAPALTRRAATPVKAAQEADASDPITAAASTAGGTTGRRMPAVGLLAAGIVLLALAAAVRSRLGGDRPPRPDEAAELVAERVAGPPQLTLVPLPDERGP
jgi:hypothetical protein